MIKLDEEGSRQVERMAKGWGDGGWDVLIVGDGSGQGFGLACGWAATLVDRRYLGGGRGGYKPFHGGMSAGTCNVAEIMPYIQALAWYEEWRSRSKPHPCDGRLTRILIVSDCLSVASQGNELGEGSREVASVKANRPLWAALREFESYGFEISFHWIKRSTCALNVACDAVAGKSRKSMTPGSMRSAVAARLLPGSTIVLPPPAAEEGGRPRAAAARKKRRRGAG